jgi:DNA-binding MarR family transcriptional regulator
MPNPKDRRARLLSLTPSGKAALAAAVPIWKTTHAALEERLPDGSGDRLRSDLAILL